MSNVETRPLETRGTGGDAGAGAGAATAAEGRARRYARCARPSQEVAPVVHGLQLWVAMPAGHRDGRPAFEHHAELPVLAVGGISATVMMGELGGVRSPATTYTPLVGADLVLAAGTDTRLLVEPSFEHAVLPLAGSVEVDGPPPCRRPGCAHAPGDAEPRQQGHAAVRAAARLTSLPSPGLS